MGYQVQAHSNATSAVLTSAMIMFASLCWGQGLPGTEWRAAPKRRIVVSIPDRQLAVLEGRTVIRTFRIAVGAETSPTPTGTFEIVNTVVLPTYFHSGVVILPGADNPVGTRWLGLSERGYGIHGTNDPQSIGKAASHGCIRLRNRDVEQLFGLVRVRDTVEIHQDRNEEISNIFDNDATTTASVYGRETAGQ